MPLLSENVPLPLPEHVLPSFVEMPPSPFLKIDPHLKGTMFLVGMDVWGRWGWAWAAERWWCWMALLTKMRMKADSYEDSALTRNIGYGHLGPDTWPEVIIANLPAQIGYGRFGPGTWPELTIADSSPMLLLPTLPPPG